MGEGFVGIFAIQRFAIDTPNAMRAALDKDFRVAIKLHAHHFVDAAGGIVPVHLVRGNVIRANFRSLRLPETSGNGQQDYDD